MDALISENILENYLQELYRLLRQRIINRSENAPEHLQEQVEQIILHHHDGHKGNEVLDAFFSAEDLFYRGNYLQALALYEKVSTTFPLSFYILRARAFICYQHRQWNQGLTLLKAAMDLFLFDPISLELGLALAKELNDMQDISLFSHLLMTLPTQLAQNEIDKLALFCQQQSEMELPFIQLERELDEKTAMESLPTFGIPADRVSPEKPFMSPLSSILSPYTASPSSDLRMEQDIMSQMHTLDELSRFLETSPNSVATPAKGTYETKFALETSQIYPSSLAHPTSLQIDLADETRMKDLLDHLLSPNSIENEPLFSAPSIPAASFDLVEHYGTEFIERRIQNFHEQQNILLKNYMDRSMQKRPLEEHCFYLLSSGTLEEVDQVQTESKSQIPTPLLPEYYRRSSSGFYFRWNGQGIVVNPGVNFLKAFHQKELYITHIDHVIVTTDHQDTYADLKGIYDLNYQYNQVRSSKDPHVIHYYLPSGVFQEMAPELKPNFKQERHMLHALELYLDSPGEESIALSDDITLYYFPILHPHNSGIGKHASIDETKLAIRLELAAKENMDKPSLTPLNSVKIAMVLGGSWSPEMVASLQNIDLLIAAFEKTSETDYKKLTYRQDCLGYYGTYSLLKECSPKLLIVCNFDGSNGDIRLDMVKKIRREILTDTGDLHNSVILPGDRELAINLEEFYISCSVCNHYILPEQVKVTKSKESFGTLRYLCGDCLM
jgi:hypothetical protein